MDILTSLSMSLLPVIASESEATFSSPTEREAIHTYGDRWVASSLRMAPLLAMTRGASVGLLAVANGVVGEVLRGFRAGHTVLDGDGLHPGVVGQREGFAVIVNSFFWFSFWFSSIFGLAKSQSYIRVTSELEHHVKERLSNRLTRQKYGGADAVYGLLPKK